MKCQGIWGDSIQITLQQLKSETKSDLKHHMLITMSFQSKMLQPICHLHLILDSWNDNLTKTRHRYSQHAHHMRLAAPVRGWKNNVDGSSVRLQSHMLLPWIWKHKYYSTVHYNTVRYSALRNITLHNVTYIHAYNYSTLHYIILGDITYIALLH